MNRTATLALSLLGALAVAACSLAPASAESEPRPIATDLPPLEPPVATMPPEEPAPSGVPVDYFVLPHPDDEYMLWSQVENRPDAFKVFILLTQGNATGFCKPGLPGYQAGTGEIKPSPVPSNNNHPTCRAARIDSWSGFFEQMSQSDPSIPGDFIKTQTGTLPGAPSQMPIKSALVWKDRQDRGVLIIFDAGDTHLDKYEARWAINTVLNNPDLFGIPEASYERMVGAYFNTAYSACRKYEHPDHGVVDFVLRNTDFGVDEQLSATCRTNPAVDVNATVSDASVEAAWQLIGSQRVGAFHRHYGWLATPYYIHDMHGQDEIFHREQAFWVDER